MQEKTQGVVLRTLKYNDNSLIVDIYTATRGTVSFMVKLPKSRKATSDAGNSSRSPTLRSLLNCLLTLR